MKKETKKVVGIVRNTDHLGRIVIPKEMRAVLGIETGEALEMLLYDDGIFVRRYKKRTLLEQLEILRHMLFEEGREIHTLEEKELERKLDEMQSLLELIEEKNHKWKG